MILRLRKCGREGGRAAPTKEARVKIKSPEVVLRLFVSASSSLLDPCRPAL